MPFKLEKKPLSLSTHKQVTFVVHLFFLLNFKIFFKLKKYN